MSNLKNIEDALKIIAFGYLNKKAFYKSKDKII